MLEEMQTKLTILENLSALSSINEFIQPTLSRVYQNNPLPELDAIIKTRQFNVEGQVIQQVCSDLINKNYPDDATGAGLKTFCESTIDSMHTKATAVKALVTDTSDTAVKFRSALDTLATVCADIKTAIDSIVTSSGTSGTSSSGGSSSSSSGGTTPSA